MAGLINSLSDVGYKLIPAIVGKYAKILEVGFHGRASILLSLSRYSNTRHTTAIITIFPQASGLESIISIDYIHGAKGQNDFEPCIFYKKESDNSISLYTSTPSYESCGYRVISNHSADTKVSIVDYVPDDAIQI